MIYLDDTKISNSVFHHLALSHFDLLIGERIRVMANTLLRETEKLGRYTQGISCFPNPENSYW